PIELPGFRYTPDRGLAFMRELERRTAELPGVVSSPLTNDVPREQVDPAVPAIVAGAPLPPPGSEPETNPHLVSARHFRTMEIPVVRGRACNDRDVQGAPRVAIVSAGMARRYWPGADPIGRQIRVPFMSRRGEPLPPFEIVGVVGDARLKGLAAEPEP